MSSPRAYARITFMGDGWPTYRVSCAEDCHDDTDRSAYEEAVRVQDTVAMGKVCVELLEE